MLISLDIFDTAIFRDVYDPKDIFSLIAPDFQNKRILAERKCNELIRHPQLKDIYKFLPGHNMQIEINLELDHCFANKKILDMYNSDRKNEYIFISDMYLPSDILVKMLEKCGYKNPKVFVSCEHRASKSSGLFKIVQEKLGRKIDKHYGDNYRADILGAKNAGITPVFLPKIQDKTLHKVNVQNPMLKRYLAEVEDTDCCSLQKLAMKYAAVLTIFTNWVLSHRKSPSTKIFFLSRDMYVPYKIAKDFMKVENVFYLHASRKSLASIALKSQSKYLHDKMDIILSKEQQKEIMTSNDDKEVVEYLKSMGMYYGDIVVDIGYIGTIQKLLELALNIKLKGLYIQLDDKRLQDLDMTFFTQRKSICSRALAEIVIGSPEKEIIGYKNCEPIFSQDSDIREELAGKLTNWMLESIPNALKLLKLPVSAKDCELILSDVQTFVDQEILDFYNSTIFSDKKKNESALNYDRELIKQGKLVELYTTSYSRPLFKKMLENDKEFAHLIGLLPK